MTEPGWYDDPSGDYQVRWWDGTQWTPHVANDGVQFEDPLDDTTLPAEEQMLWSHGAKRLSTHRIWLPDPANRSRIVELDLWAVRGAEVTRNMGQSVRGTGRIAVEVDYAGYVGPRHWTMKGIPDADGVAALIRKWANRNRRAAGGSSQ